MRALPPAAETQCGVFTVAQACEAGWTRSAIRHAVSTGELIALRRGVFATAPEPTPPWLARNRRAAQETVAALLSYPGSYASHRGAALLLDLPVLELPARPCLTVPPGRSGDTPGIHLHRATLDPGERGRLRSVLRLTMPGRLVVDIARELGEAAGVVTADAALHRGLLTPAELVDGVERARGRPAPLPLGRWPVRWIPGRSHRSSPVPGWPSATTACPHHGCSRTSNTTAGSSAVPTSTGTGSA